MAKVLQVTGNIFTQSSGLTRYHSCANSNLRPQSVEAETQITYRTAGTLSNLWVRLSSNSINGSSTIRTRVNGGNGNQSVSFASSTSGTAEDTSNTDAISVADEVNYSAVTGGSSGSLAFQYNNTLFAADSDTVIHHAATHNSNITNASTTDYTPLAGLAEIQNV